MKRKETDAEREIAEKWKDVAEVKDAYNESLLPRNGIPSPDEPSERSAPPPKDRRTQSPSNS